jgi:hypothetical protein
MGRIIPILNLRRLLIIHCILRRLGWYGQCHEHNDNVLNAVSEENNNNNWGTVVDRQHQHHRILIQQMSGNEADGAVPLRSHYSEGPLSLQKHGLLKGYNTFRTATATASSSSSSTTKTTSMNTATATATTIGTNTVNSVAESKQYKFRDDVNTFISNPNQIPRAIIHVGPHKTATTSIQALSAIMHKYINADGYEMPWGLIATNISAVNKERYVNLNQFNLVSCLQDIEPLWPEAKCNLALVEAVNIIGRRKQSLIVSAEELSRTNLVKFDRLYDLLVPYYGINNIRIVVYYRRFYEWLYSYWQQFAKYRSVPDRKTFPQYVADISSIKSLHDTTYTTGCVNKYSQYFTDVAVFNMHDLTNDIDVSEHFYCEAIPNSNSTCREVHNRNQRKKRLDLNTGKELVYEELAYYAQQAGLWSSSVTGPLQGKNPRQVGMYVHYFHQHVQNKTSFDFVGYITCPDPNILQWLYTTTINDEERFFPEFYKSSNGLQTIQEKFTIDSQTKLCSIDAKAVIANEVSWKDFFRTLSIQGSIPFQQYDDGIRRIDAERKARIIAQARKYDAEQALKFQQPKKK